MHDCETNHDILQYYTKNPAFNATIREALGDSNIRQSSVVWLAVNKPKQCCFSLVHIGQAFYTQPVRIVYDVPYTKKEKFSMFMYVHCPKSNQNFRDIT